MPKYKCYRCGGIHGNSEAETARCYRTMPIETRKFVWDGMEIERLSEEYDKEQRLKKWRSPVDA